MYKLVIVGNSGSGKSSLLQRFADHDYRDSHTPTIGVDFKMRTVQIGTKQIKLSTFDTAGTERFHSIISSYYRGADAIIFVYDIGDEQSYQDIDMWLKEVEYHAAEGVKQILIGNKCDLPPEKKFVDSTRAKIFAEENKMLFYEASAKQNINVDELFLSIASEIDNARSSELATKDEKKIHISSEPVKMQKSRCCL